MSYTNFKSRVLNHGYDHDGHYGWQCWDGFVEWCKENGIPQINTKPISQGGTGYVQDLWEFRKTNGMLDYFDEVEIMQQSDVAIFKKHPWTPSSHVAIFDSDIDGKYGYFLGQNQGSTITHPQGGSAFNLVKLPYEATYPTAFRIKKKGNNQVEQQIRGGIPQVGVTPYTQIHAHSTGNPNSTAQNEADYMSRKDINTGFYTHVVGNGRVIQVANVNRGAWDVGGGWNYETYAAVELIESHKTKAEFERDYKLYVTLLRDLAKQAGLSNNLDTGTSGIITHAYATAHQPNNASDHVDPYPYLAKWGISKAQFAKDLKNGFSGSTVKASPTPQKSYKVYRADDVKFVSGLWQIKCNDLTPTQFTWIENGIPVAMVNWVDKNGKNITDGKDNQFKKGMYFTFAGDETYITDTGVGGYNYGYYWRKFTFGNFGAVWLSAWNKNHLVNGTK